MNLARRSFFWSGVYGLVVLIPMYFFEHRTGIDTPPPITHPEFYYGFIGVAIAWQMAFIVISRDPVRFRPLMIPAIVEKLSFIAALVGLFSLGRTSDPMLALAGALDAVMLALFVASYGATRTVDHGRPGERKLWMKE
ncbi:MAG: hypothetical protein JO102_04165 [Elusimicrobia bacterium]|nr:hypothetical protein [Elusimicrobiota bacterium]